MDGNEFTDLVGTVVKTFALEFVKDNAIYVTEQVRNLLYGIGAIDSNSISAANAGVFGVTLRRFVHEKLVISTIVTSFTSHAVLWKEQRANVFEESIGTILQVIFEPVKDCELALSFEKTFNHKAVKVSSFTACSVCSAHINLRHISVSIL
jgi:hypothetical protein